MRIPCKILVYKHERKNFRIAQSVYRTRAGWPGFCFRQG